MGPLSAPMCIDHYKPLGGHSQLIIKGGTYPDGGDPPGPLGWQEGKEIDDPHSYAFED